MFKFTILSSFLLAASIPALAATTTSTTSSTSSSSSTASQGALSDMDFQKTGETTLEAANAIEAEAEVLKVDKKTREIKLKSQDGEEFSIVAGPEVRNFDQIKKHDRLKVSYLESAVLELKKGGGEPVMVSEQTDSDRSRMGMKPGAVVTDIITARGTITAVNWKKQQITLQGPHRTMILPVEKEVLGRIKKGDQIEARLTQAMAISVESTKK